MREADYPCMECACSISKLCSFEPFPLSTWVAFSTAAGKQLVVVELATLVVPIIFCRQHLGSFWCGSDAAADCWCELDGCCVLVDTNYMRSLDMMQLVLGFLAHSLK